MKKVLFILIAITCLLTVTSCKKNCIEKNNNPCNYNNDLFSEGLTVIKSSFNNRYGYINEKGEKVIDCKFITATNFENGYAIVGLDNGKSDVYYNHDDVIIDKMGNQVTEAYDFIDYDEDYKLYRLINFDGYTILLNNKLEQLAIYNGIESFYEGYAFTQFDESTYGFINTKGEVMYQYHNPNYHHNKFLEGRAICEVHNGTDADGNIIWEYVVIDTNFEVIFRETKANLGGELERVTDNYIYVEGRGASINSVFNIYDYNFNLITTSEFRSRFIFSNFCYGTGSDHVVFTNLLNGKTTDSLYQNDYWDNYLLGEDYLVTFNKGNIKIYDKSFNITKEVNHDGVSGAFVTEDKYRGIYYIDLNKEDGHIIYTFDPKKIELNRQSQLDNIGSINNIYVDYIEFTKSERYPDDPSELNHFYALVTFNGDIFMDFEEYKGYRFYSTTDGYLVGVLVHDADYMDKFMGRGYRERILLDKDKKEIFKSDFLF